MNVSGLSSGVTEVAVGGAHTCALTSAGGVKCWGANNSGQLGNGLQPLSSSTPVEVIGLSAGVIGIAAGPAHTCAVTSSGAVKCWGFNGAGELGNGTTTNIAVPVDVIGVSNAIAVAAGGHHTCAVTNEGDLKCWGDNYWGQLSGTRTGASVDPVDVYALAGEVTSVAAGWGHTCAVTSSGGLKCWGWNEKGLLGDGTWADSIIPVNVSGLSSGVTAVTAGGDVDGHTCAITSTEGLKCWGPGIAPALASGGALLAAIARCRTRRRVRSELRVSD